MPIPEEFNPLRARVIDKRGRCDIYEIGDEFPISSPFFWLKPCESMWFAAWPFLIGAGFRCLKSWETDDPNVFRILYPSKKGIAAELRPGRLLLEKLKVLDFIPRYS